MSLVPCQNLGQRQLLQSCDKTNNAEYDLNKFVLQLQRLVAPCPCRKYRPMAMLRPSVRRVGLHVTLK